MLSFLTLSLGIAEQAIKLGADVGPIFDQMRSVISSGADPTTADWQALAANESALRKRLNAPSGA